MDKSHYLDKITSWDAGDASHILSRTLFGFTQNDVTFALSKTLDDFVDNYLLKDQPAPPAPTYNGTNWTSLPNNTTNQANYTNWQYSLIYWWYNLMLNQGYSFSEKMVLFLHNNFTSQYSTVGMPQLMYIQNQLFRQYAFGNFKDLAKKVTIDPAMLDYLNGEQNSKGAPNENYSRELMELFTLGIGNYTQTDVTQAARALTGYRIDRTNLVSTFNPNLFDNGTKTFLGQTGNWGYSDIIDIIFAYRDASNNPVSAQFICRKLYKEFVYYEPVPDADADSYIAQLADLFVTNNYNLKPVLSALLKSQYFHSTDIRGARIKPPVEFLLSALKQFGIPIDSSNNVLGYVRSVASNLQQTLFDPPDVRGWQGQRNWISTITYPTRNNFTDYLVNGYPSGSKPYMKIDALTYSRTYVNSEDAVKFIDDITAQLIQFPISDQRKSELLSTLLDGAAVYDWSTYSSSALSRLQNFFIALMRLPEFQLS